MAGRELPVKVLPPPETLEQQLDRLTWSAVGERQRGRGETRTPRTVKERLQTFRLVGLTAAPVFRGGGSTLTGNSLPAMSFVASLALWYNRVPSS
ncbi:hypothetical protein SKAU_G00412380 [Synaphobranchus kaupii]|uniref:Uncharacterized protein n=1 Tax=Synaphobranchus kaupii TaxID=118154 RepID=A0A9Q1E803_SYNKA|nr:hypothetical protein SKAU_G00412380 [Synaphobranchus kaupii]